MIVLRLLRHRERAGHGDLYALVGVTAQEFEVAHLHRLAATDLTAHARHRNRLAAAVERGAVIFHVDAVERGGEAVRIALAAHLAIGNDVEPRRLLLTDGDDGGIVPRLLEQLGIDLPQLNRARARGKAAGKLRPVDQPVGLRIRADQRGRQKGQRHRNPLVSSLRRTAGPAAIQAVDENRPVFRRPPGSSPGPRDDED